MTVSQKIINLALINKFDSEKDENSKFENLKNLMNQHDIIVKEQEDAEKKMDLEKTAFEEAAKESTQKKEECDKIRSELSSSFSDAAQSLSNNQGRYLCFLISVKWLRSGREPA